MFAFNDSPFDDFYRLRRQMNDVFSDFDRSFGHHDPPFMRDPFFVREPLHAQPPQPRLTEHAQRDTKAEEKYGAGGTEQKADSMSVESNSNGAGSGDSLVQSSQQTAPALIRPRNELLAPWARIQMPKCDVVENADNYLITCDLPGMTKEDVKLSINDHGLLTISAEHSSSSEQKDPQAKYHRVERHYGKFERSLPLPKNVELEHVSAKHENGLLKINLPKKPQSKVDTNKHIQIQ